MTNVWDLFAFTESLCKVAISHSQNLDRSQTSRVSGFVNNDSYYKAITCAGEREGFRGKMRKNCSSWQREKGHLICLSDLTGYTGNV